MTGTFGQAAPGFVAAGDLNDNGRLDIAVSGDGSRAVYRLAQQPDRERRQFNHRHAAVTLQSAGEIDIWPLIENLRLPGKITCLPVLPLLSQRRLRFSPCTMGYALVGNRYGIMEPEPLDIPVDAIGTETRVYHCPVS